MFKRIHITHLYFFLFLICIICLLGITLIVSSAVFSQEIEKTISTHQQIFLEELNNKVFAQLHSIELMSLTASQDLRRQMTQQRFSNSDAYLNSRNDSAMVSALANYVYSTNFLDSIHLYMKNPFYTGEQHSVQLLDISILKDNEEFGILGDKTYGWIPEHTIYSSLGDTEVISFTRKIYNIRALDYLLVLNVKTRQLKKLLDDSNAEGVQRVLLNPDGLIMATIGVPEETDKENWNWLLTEHEKTGSSGNTRIYPSGDLLVWNRNSSGWTLMEITPWAQISQRIQRTNSMILLAGLLIGLIGCIIAYMFSRQLAKPIRQLEKAMSLFPSREAVRFLPDDYQNEFGVLFTSYRNLMDKNEELMKSLNLQYKQSQEAEMQAFLAMINPHFLYNTLDQINWMAIDAGQEEISRALSLVARMFNMGLANSGTKVALKNEVQHIQYYFQVQDLKWKGRLTHTITIEDGLEEAYVPRFILQPFVENSIIHGFHGREKGHIDIRAHKKEEYLEIIITDDGVGIREDWMNENHSSGGYGMHNVIKRIGMLYEPPCGIKIRRRESGGTELTILLPIQWKEE